MKSWPAPSIPVVDGTGPTLELFDTARGGLFPVAPDGPGTLAAPARAVTMYVCGITPYDATHLGHAATYVTFDLVARVLRDRGHQVRYAQNVTDIDDPLLERAALNGMDWRDLATMEIDLFREDMAALEVIPPDDYVGVVESMPLIVDAVQRLVDSGATYRLEAADGLDGGRDIYLDATAVAHFGDASGWTREQMHEVFADRGGDPDREGKRDPLDPLLWRAARAGEPTWPGGSLGSGRPGWHIECTAIAERFLDLPVDLQGGGSDLVFPHHEMSAVQGEVLRDGGPYARHFVHQAMVGYHGEKMSKSKGNLVLVSALRRAGVSPGVIRLGLLAHHYRQPWEWTVAEQDRAQQRFDRWRSGARSGARLAAAEVAELRAALADDLDSPAALTVVDRWADRVGPGGSGSAARLDPVAVIRALLGVHLDLQPRVDQRISRSVERTAERG